LNRIKNKKETHLTRRSKTALVLIITLILHFGFGDLALAQTDAISSADSAASRPVLVRAVVCQSIEDLVPINEAAIFPLSVGSVACYTLFEPISKDTTIFHRWYHRDKITSVKKLNLRSPRWATYSSIQIRKGDNGPWRVEIVDGDGHVYRILRFSLTE
jgi:hypothetical protein